MSNSQSWLLLEYTDDLPERLYRLGENPNPYRLFDETELELYAEQSPLLISTHENPSVAADFLAQPNDWMGLKLESSQPLQVVLQHLRHILFVSFEGERKGVLRYTNPRTASYFYPSLDSSELVTWLGPICSLSWFGATWRESAESQACWFSQENLRAEQWQAEAKPAPLALGKGQTAALQSQQTEKFLFHWWQKQSRLSFDQAFAYLQEGMNSGFLSADSLNTYLDIRTTYRGIATPDMLPPGSDETRLSHLETSLKGNATDKESHA
ncbi:DUF4123 domain-containing protein [Pseudomonas sp. EL_65y_Pfl2_R95]|uniref:DUF4123 domain-containing protein n=1 Tax=Pseudomonas sp. EL_65y_Pfl2_R95 TaxID=3088698 RepID=UPI0030DC38C3